MDNGGGSEQQLLPRLCCPEKGPNGYGFHLHGEKGKTSQFIRLVEPDSPAEKSGLKAGDRLVEVNGENVEKESHQQVVNRIRGSSGSVRLLVVDSETDELLQKLGLECREEFVRGLPEKSEAKSGGREAALQEQENEMKADGEGSSHATQRTPATATGETSGNRTARTRPHSPENPQPPSDSGRESLGQYIPETDYGKELRPRLCQMKKGPKGYGFNLHSDKTKPGQYVRAVDPDSPAESAGLRPQDRIIEVNGQCMEGKQHSDVVSAIKSGGDETKLLVVDSLTDEFFKKCKVIPSEAHLKGLLPEPVANGDVEKGNLRDDQSETDPESPSTPVTVSPSSTISEPCTELHSHEKEEKLSTTSDPILDLDIPLAVAKERAHQKRTSKRAPQMDWSKKNELFSNL